MPSSHVTLTDDTPAQNGGAYTGLPKWAKVIAVVGAPVFFAAYLIYLLGSNVSGKVESSHSALTAHIIESEAHQEDFKGFMIEHLRSEQGLNSILIQLCVRLSETQAERKMCFPTVK